MTELLRELEAVVDRTTHAHCVGDDGLLIDAGFDAMDFIRTHHAEISEALADARRYRWLRTLQGEVLTKTWTGESWCDASYTELDTTIDAAIDAAIDAHNSAREVGE